MRWYGQLAVIAALGAVGYGGWMAHRSGALANLPVVGGLLPANEAPAATAPQPGRAGPPPVVEVAPVGTGRIVETRQAVGTLRAFESVTLASKVSGIVEEILFEEGGKVEAGAVLVRLDAAERVAEFEQAEAEIIRATAQADELRQRLERARSLRRTGAGTEAQVEDLSAQVRSAEAASAAAEARKRAAQARRQDLTIRAPFAGRLGTREISLGAYVSAGTKIASLDDLTRMRLDFSVPENLVGRVASGQRVDAFSPAFPDRRFSGAVTLIDPRVDPATRAVRLVAEFENPDEALKPGMFLSVALEVTAREDAVVVPEEAIVNEGLRHIVYTVDAESAIERRVVRIGQRQGGKVEIVEGLSPGETLVVLGVQRVRPGGKVTARPIGATTVPQAQGEPRAGAAIPTQNQPIGAASAADRRS